ALSRVSADFSPDSGRSHDTAAPGEKAGIVTAGLPNNYAAAPINLPAPLLFHLPDPDIAEQDVVRLAVILQADVPLGRPVLQRPLVEAGVDDLLAVELHLQLRADTGDDHAVPLVRRPRHVLRGGGGADDAAVVVRRQFSLLVGGIENLRLDAGFDGVGGVTDAEENAAVASGRIGVLDIEHEVAVLLVGPEVVVVALPAGLALAG